MMPFTPSSPYFRVPALCCAPCDTAPAVMALLSPRCRDWVLPGLGAAALLQPVGPCRGDAMKPWGFLCPEHPLSNAEEFCIPVCWWEHWRNW